MSAARLLVVSRPSHVAVNRAVYGELAARHGVPVHLVVPQRIFLGGRWRNTALDASAPYEMSALPFAGTHGRLQRAIGLRRLVVQWRPTHVLVDSDPASLLAWQAVRLPGSVRAWAMTAENLMPRSGPGPFLVSILRSQVLPRLDRVFTLSTAGTQVVEALGGRATQIPLGFDPGLFRVQTPEQIAATRARLGLRHRTIAYFGRLAPEKGVHLLIEALRVIKDLDWQFLIDRFGDYGSGYTAQVREMIDSHDIASRVVYFDATHEEMPGYMNAADIVALPSVSTPRWKEQYGRVLPEAMACGKAVVGSSSGAIPELVKDYGRIFPEGDVRALAQTLRDLLHSPDLEARGQRAAAYAQQELSITRQAAIWADLLARSA